MADPDVLRSLAIALALAAAPAFGEVYDGSRQVGALFEGATELNGVFVGTAPVFDSKPPVGAPATISDWGATKGEGKTKRLTLTLSELPNTIRMSATLTGAARWEIWRDAGGGHTIIAEGTNAAPAATQALATDFRPPASGWSYRLHAYASAANGADAEDSLLVRVTTPPTLTVFRATVPANVQAPGVDRQCVWLTWTATEGDPAAVWNMTQAGRVIAALPSSSRLTPSHGRATGNDRQRVCVNTGGGLTSTLTLGGRNEAGNVSRAVVINWAGG